jgi:hypothetical protein
MKDINFDVVIENIRNIDDESVKAGVLCELAKGIVSSNEDKDVILERMNIILDIADSFNDSRYKSIVIGQIALVCANYLNIPCDSDTYIGMIDSAEAEKKFVERINKLKNEV